VSLRLRLALWYGGLAALVMLLAGVVVYAWHGRGEYEELDRSLIAAARHVAEAHGDPATAHELAEMVAAPLGPNLVLRLHTRDHGVLETGPSAALAPAVDPAALLGQPGAPPFDPIVGLAPAWLGVDPGRGAFGLAPAADTNRWRLYALPMDDAAQYLLAAAPLNAIDSSVAAFRRLTLLLAAFGGLVSLAGGWLVVGRALRPVGTVTETARAIAGSTDFGRRVPALPQQDELGRLAATFNEMLASLEEAYRAQRRFVADASHELRAPLTAIQANLELLERHPDLPPAEQREAVTEASREAHRLARLVADLLALARADAGIPLRHERVELDRVLVEVIGEARHLAKGQKIEVEALMPALVQGDPDRLKQLLLVLVDNAIKYTPADGRVSLALRRDRATAEVRVHDTGIGIPAEDLPHVFERFYRADQVRARDPGGTGLGLPIARWIAQQHGGDVTLASDIGHGTTATLRLPLPR